MNHTEDQELIESALVVTRAAMRLINHNHLPEWNQVFDALGLLTQAKEAADKRAETLLTR